MKILNHHIYEYKKGIRNLFLHTLPIQIKHIAEARMQRNNISYFINEVSDKRINIFFGDEECVDVVKSFGDKGLNRLTAEEDFMLGIMLGYNTLEQCKRYIKLKLVTQLKSVV